MTETTAAIHYRSEASLLKPHKGRIIHWEKYPCPGHGLGFLIVGTFLNHPEFGDFPGHTSWVEDMHPNDDGTVEIETRNSRYTLITSTDSSKAAPKGKEPK